MPRIGPCELVVGDDALFRDAGIPRAAFALFRSQDLAVVPVEDSFESFVAGAEPAYKVFERDDFGEEGREFLVLVADAFRSEFHDVLHRLTQEYPEYRIGVVTDDAYPAIQVIISKSLSYVPDVFLVNPGEGYFYPNNGSFCNVTVDGDDFVNRVRRYVADIREKRVEPVYYSEEIPDEDAGDVHKVVGVNYREFVEDTENDVVVLYSPEFGAEEVFTAFREVAESLRGKNIKFGIYDNIRNASPLKLPEFVQYPHIEIFPKGNKDNSKPMLSLMNANGLYRFLNEYSTENIDVNVEKITREEAFQELEMLNSAYERMSEKTQKLISNYIETKLSNLTDSNNADESVHAMG